jgi:hypothetical protein
MILLKNSLILRVLIAITLSKTAKTNQTFCKDGRIDTAFSVSDWTFLIRNNTVWYFDYEEKTVSPQSATFEQFLNDTRVKTITTAFTSVGNNSNIIVYVIAGEKYYLFKKSDHNLGPLPISFTPMEESDHNYLPNKWNWRGGESLGGLMDLPSVTFKGVTLNHTELYLIHDKSIRHYWYMGSQWPTNYTDFPFGDHLKGIDAVFGLPLKSDPENVMVIIVNGLKYCSFRKKSVDLNDIVDSCEWKDSRQFFRCLRIETTTQITIGTQTTEETKTKTTQRLTTSTSKTTSAVIVLTGDESDSNQFGFFPFIFGVIIVVIVIVIVSATVGIILYKKSNTSTKTSDSSSSEHLRNKRGDDSSNLLDRATSSVITIDSVTGQPLNKSISSNRRTFPIDQKFHKSIPHLKTPQENDNSWECEECQELERSDLVYFKSSSSGERKNCSPSSRESNKSQELVVKSSKE